MAFESDSAQTLAAIYAGYLGRAPDPAGLTYWLDELEDGDLSGVADALGRSDEARGVNALLADPTGDAQAIQAFLDTVWDNLFDADPGQAATDFWTTEIQDRVAAGQSLNTVILDIFEAAEGDEAAAAANKGEVGARYADAFLGTGVDWTAGQHVVAATEAIAEVGAGADSVTAALDALDGRLPGASVTGGDGDDEIASAGGPNTIDGGAGSDTVDYSGATAGVDADLRAGSASVGAGFAAEVDDQPFTDVRADGAIDDAAMVRALLDGELYFNIHTADFPAGQVRGQLSVTQDSRDADGVGRIAFTADLDGGQLVPPADTSATGNAFGTVTVNADGTATYDASLDIKGIAPDSLIDVGGVNSPIHFHLAPAGENGPIVVDVAGDVAASGNEIAADTGVTDTLRNVENLTGSAFDDRLFGDGNANVLDGGEGNDAFHGFGAADSIDGGGGTDTVLYNAAQAEVAIDLRDGTATAGAGFSAAVAGQGFSDVRGDGALSDAGMVQALLDGELYFNIHTAAFPAGQVRGQISVTQDNRDVDGVGTIAFEATLSGDQLVPAADTSATGAATGSLTVAADGTVTYDSQLDVTGIDPDDLIDVGGVNSPIHLHLAPAGENGPIVVDIAGDSAASTDGIAAVAGVTDTLSNLENATGGVFDDTLNGDGNANVLEGNDGNDVLMGRGGADTIDGGAGTDTLKVSGGDTAQLVDLAAGTAYTDFGFDASVEGASFADVRGDGALSDAGMVQALLDGELYVNIHTADNPGGELRGQLSVTADNRDGDGVGTIAFEATVSGDQLVPAVDTEASGNIAGTVSVAADGLATYTTELSVDGIAPADLISVGGVNSPIHFHNAPAGENGPIVVDVAGDAAAAGSAIAATGGTGDTLANIENVLGGGGDDVLQGDAGDNVLEGGDGADVFAFDAAAGVGADTVVDFADGSERLVVFGVEGFDNLTITDGDSGAEVTFAGAEGRIAVNGVAAADLTADDFSFG